MLVKDFYYDLPKELIAQDPLEQRDNSKLLVMDRETGNIEHRVFHDVIDYLNEGDVLVLNETKVIPARLIGTIIDRNDAVCEVFLVKRMESDIWECLVKPGKKLKIGAKVLFSDELSCEIINILEDGNRIVKFYFNGIFEEIIDRLGEMPLPPYITHKLNNKNRYQTVYAKNEGSVAAPTAGLHFTNDLLDKIDKKKINIAKLTLHVSLGTFRPVKVDTIEEHKMHSEKVHIANDVCDVINRAKENNKRIICVGTTSCRSIESAAVYNEEKKIYELKPFHSSTNIFIYPGYKFKLMDGLITNFHLPESTLLMLVSAFTSREKILNAYNEAIKNKYRFFSFGDACLFI